MHRVSASPVTTGSLGVIALGCWWLANLALLKSSGFDAAPILAARAAAYAWLAQAACVILVVTHRPPERSAPSLTARVLPIVVTMAPFWPLYVLLWQTSRIPAAEFLIAQIGMFFVAATTIAVVATAKLLPGIRKVEPLVPGVLSLILFSGVWLLRNTLTGGFL